MVQPSRESLEKAPSFTFRTANWSTNYQSFGPLPFHPPLPSLHSSPSTITPQTHDIPSDYSHLTSEKNLNLQKSLGLERKERLTEDKGIEGYTIPPNQLSPKEKENITGRENGDAKENEAPAVNYDKKLTSQTSTIISHAAEEQTLPSLTVTGLNTAKGDSTEHYTTPHSIIQPLLPDSDGNNCDDLNHTDKLDNHTREDAYHDEDNKGMTDNPGDRSIKSSSSSKEGSNEKWTLQKLNVTGIGLYVPMPPKSIRQLLAPLFTVSHKAVTPSKEKDR